MSYLLIVYIFTKITQLLRDMLAAAIVEILIKTTFIIRLTTDCKATDATSRRLIEFHVKMFSFVSNKSIHYLS